MVSSEPDWFAAVRAAPVAVTLVQSVSRTITIAGFPLSTWAFALRIWAAMMVALYAAFWLQLESASSAAVTVGIELQADNSDGKLYGGAYCRVDFQVPGDPSMVRLPATALMPANRGTQVAILGGDGKVALKAIQLRRDFGDTVEVTAGLSPQDQVIDSPPETLQTGDAVQVGPATGPAPKPAGKPNSPATQ
jgi:multidrug efflux pump subunit AcrA (membrane-fusion protein)